MPLLSLATLVSFVSCSDDKEKKIQPSSAGRVARIINVDAFIVKKEAFGELIEVPGTVIPNEATTLHPEISGRLVELHVREGATVKKGTLLAKLYDADLQAQLKKLDIQLRIAETNEQRSAQLLAIQGISQADYDASLLNVHNIKADMDIVKANIVRTEIRAPFDGKLGLRQISPGAYVSPATILATIYQTNQLKLDFTVPEKYASQVQAGMKVQFGFTESNELYTATVAATETAVAENTRSLMVRALVQNHMQLLPGTFAKVILNLGEYPNALLIPSQSVIPQARGKQVALYKNGEAVLTDVITGVRDSSRVKIEKGINSGDTVITTGLLSLKDKDKVAITRIVN